MITFDTESFKHHSHIILILLPISNSSLRRPKPTLNPARFCKVCGTKLEGRRDKKYCNQSCKNQYHYDMRALHRTEVSADLGFLFRNRTILHEILDQENSKKKKVPRSLLQFMGFRFPCYTGSHMNKQGKTYYFIFDYSWMAFSDKEVLILKRD